MDILEIIENIPFKYFHNILENPIKFQGINPNTYVVFRDNYFTLVINIFYTSNKNFQP